MSLGNMSFILEYVSFSNVVLFFMESISIEKYIPVFLESDEKNQSAVFVIRQCNGGCYLFRNIFYWDTGVGHFIVTVS